MCLNLSLLLVGNIVSLQNKYRLKLQTSGRSINQSRGTVLRIVKREKVKREKNRLPAFFRAEVSGAPFRSQFQRPIIAEDQYTWAIESLSLIRSFSYRRAWRSGLFGYFIARQRSKKFLEVSANFSETLTQLDSLRGMAFGY